jgi:large subunit ribosomal protein L4
VTSATDTRTDREVDVRTPAGETSGTVTLPGALFDASANVALIHQVVVAQLAAARQGTHATKTRGKVSGGGAKPYRQKGTGRARQGSTRAPQFAGGGIVHGPQPRDYTQKTPKKMKAAALRAALSDRAREDRVHVVSTFVDGDKPKTKAALATLDAVTQARKVLVVLDRADALNWVSLRNEPRVHLLDAGQLNTYDVLNADDVVFTKGAYDAFVNGTGAAGSSATATAATSDEVTESPADEQVLPAGAKAPLKSGKNPKGYDVLGLESGSYLVEGDAAYDVAGGDFWFKSVEDAEAAGLTRAKEDDK